MNYKNYRVAPERHTLPRFVHKAFQYGSYFRITVEPLIRRHFGKRYFPFWKALVILCALACWPLIVKENMLSRIWHFAEADTIASMPDRLFWLRYSTWYAYLAALFVFCIRSKIEAGKGNGAKSPNYAGDLLPMLYRLNIGGKTLSLWALEVICEPALFFIGGFLLYRMGQSLGLLLMICAVGYAISYFCAYLISEEDALNRISNAMDGEEWGNTIMKDIPSASMTHRPPRSFDDEIED